MRNSNMHPHHLWLIPVNILAWTLFILWLRGANRPRPKATEPTFQEKLHTLGAGTDALVWVGDKTMEEAWESCTDSDWMRWLFVKILEGTNWRVYRHWREGNVDAEYDYSFPDPEPTLMRNRFPVSYWRNDFEVAYLKYRDNTTFQRQLRAIGACPAAIDWVGRRTFRQAWEECDNPQWMRWFLRTGLYIPGPDQAFCDEICQFFWQQNWYVFLKLETAEERCRFIRENYPLKRFQEQFERAVAHNRAEHPE